MRYTVVVDNMSVSLKLLAEWGYAALLETPGGNVLLDTGLRRLHADAQSERVAAAVRSGAHSAQSWA